MDRTQIASYKKFIVLYKVYPDILNTLIILEICVINNCITCIHMLYNSHNMIEVYRLFYHLGKVRKHN